jgi:hypothetical protein
VAELTQEGRERPPTEAERTLSFHIGVFPRVADPALVALYCADRLAALSILPAVSATPGAGSHHSRPRRLLAPCAPLCCALPSPSLSPFLSLSSLFHWGVGVEVPRRATSTRQYRSTTGRYLYSYAICYMLYDSYSQPAPSVSVAAAGIDPSQDGQSGISEIDAQ